MPAAIEQQPEKLIKSQLQRRLKDHGVTVPSTLLKSELVELYKTKVLAKSRASNEEERFARITRSAKKMVSSEFQSESDGVELVKTITAEGADVAGEGRKSPRVRKKPVRYVEESEGMLTTVQKSDADQEKSTSEARVKLQRIDDTMTNVLHLSDEQLSEELKLRGFDVGPIGPTTRRIYEKRLKSLQLAGAGDSAMGEIQDDSDEESDNEDIEVVESPMETRYQRRLLLRNPELSGSATRRRPMRESPGKEERNYLKGPVVPDINKLETPAKPERRWKPVLMALLIVAVLVVLLYFVFLSMESNPPKRIPHP